MASKIGSLVVDLVMDAARFSAGTKKAGADTQKLNQKLAKFERRMRTVGRRVDRFASRLNFKSVAVGVAALTGATVAATKFADRISDTSAAIGIGTTAYQEYAFAAEQTGFSGRKV